MAWETKGLLLPAPVPVSWAVSHASLPHVVEDGGAPHLFFSGRDEEGRSQIGRVALDVSEEGLRVTGPAERLLAPGELGAFDDSGVTTSCLVPVEERRYLYYTGWARGVTVPFYLFVGCAISDDGETYERVSEAPMLERNDVDPFLTASPWVLREDGRWRMWYVSATGWHVVDGQPQHRYHIRYAESADGLSWNRDGTVCIDYEDEHEYAMSRPCVVRDDNLYRMWFAARGDTYRLAYAESEDGVVWERRDDEAQFQSSGEWDTEMRAYPAVFDHGGRRYLLYNGNDYGRTGIGWAVETTSA